MKMKIFAVLILSVVVIGGVWVLTRRVPSPAKSGKLVVVTTLFPLYDFAKNIGGDKADVSLLLPPGTEPHSFDPKPSDVVKIDQAKVFVYTGKFMEPWAEDIAGNLSGKTHSVVDASAGISLEKSVAVDPDEPVGAKDPHIWLDFGNDEKIIDNILAGFVAQDPANADYFRANAVSYKNSLALLDDASRAALATCKQKEIVYGGHYAFGYFAKRYGLKYVAAQGVSPDAEPTAKDLIALVKQIRENGVQYVFYEELTSSKIADTIASETGAKLLSLSAGHNVTKKQLDDNVSFLAIMEQNLANLKTGLGCSGK